MSKLFKYSFLPLIFIAVSVLLWIVKVRIFRPTFENLRPIDAHVHVFQNDPDFRDMLQRHNLQLVDICYVDKHQLFLKRLEPVHAMALGVSQQSQKRIVWCSTFDPADWEDPGFADRTIHQLERTFQQGAVGVKMYKNIGMELKSKDGRYLMPDDPVFDPILKCIEAHNKTLFTHLAEPSAAWKALNPDSPHYGYYKKHPEWHMYLYPDRPSKASILEARDRLLKRHPRLRVIGCHLGSMEDDLDQIARDLEQYPNFAVDTAARIPDLMLLPREKVRHLFIRFQDRIIYGSDLSFLPNNKPEEAIKTWEGIYKRDWRFLATEKEIKYMGKRIRGLGLPSSVLRKIFRKNALRWIPDLSGEK